MLSSPARLGWQVLPLKEALGVEWPDLAPAITGYIAEHGELYFKHPDSWHFGDPPPLRRPDWRQRPPLIVVEIEDGWVPSRPTDPPRHWLPPGSVRIGGATNREALHPGVELWRRLTKLYKEGRIFVMRVEELAEGWREMPPDLWPVLSQYPLDREMRLRLPQRGRFDDPAPWGTVESDPVLAGSVWWLGVKLKRRPEAGPPARPVQEKLNEKVAKYLRDHPSAIEREIAEQFPAASRQQIREARRHAVTEHVINKPKPGRRPRLP